MRDELLIAMSWLAEPTSPPETMVRLPLPVALPPSLASRFYPRLVQAYSDGKALVEWRREQFQFYSVHRGVLYFGIFDRECADQDERIIQLVYEGWELSGYRPSLDFATSLYARFYCWLFRYPKPRNP